MLKQNPFLNIALTALVSSAITLFAYNAYEAHIAGIIAEKTSDAELYLMGESSMVRPAKAEEAAWYIAMMCYKENTPYHQCVEQAANGHIASYPKAAEDFNKKSADLYFYIQSDVDATFVLSAFKDLLRANVSESRSNHRFDPHAFEKQKSDEYLNEIIKYALVYHEQIARDENRIGFTNRQNSILIDANNSIKTPF